MNGVSVIICCYNSASRIVPTLNHLKKQEGVDGISWEVVVVDNNSTDNTAEVAGTTWGDFDVPLRIVHEPNPGLANARAAGVSSAKYDFIIFCDDDNWLCSTYVSKVYCRLTERPAIAAVGGQGIAAFEEGFEVPAWFEKNKKSYAVGKQAEHSKDITDEQLYLWGAGIGLRKKVIQQAFDSRYPSLLMGRSGEKLTAGDDAEMCMRFVIMGYRLYYDEELVYYHFLPPGRLTVAYLEKMKEGFLHSFGLQTLYTELIRNFVFQSTGTAIIVKKIYNELFYRRNFFLTESRRFIYWKWGLPLLNNSQQKLLRGFFLAYGHQKSR